MQAHPCFGGQRPPAVTRAEFATPGFTARPPRRRALHRLPHAGHARRRGACAWPAAASRSSTRTTRASTRCRTSTASATRTTRSCAGSTTSSPTLLESLPAGHGAAWSPPTTARSRWATTCSTLPGDVLAHVAMQSGEGRFRWLHARSRPGRRAARRGRRELLGDHAWVRSRRRRDRRGLVRPDRHRRGRGPPGRRAARRQGRRRLQRPERHRPVLPRRPPRLAHRGRDARAAARRRRRAETALRGRLARMSDEPRRRTVRRRRCSCPRWSPTPRPTATARESVESPGKVMRIGSMIKQLLEEVRAADARRAQPRAAAGDLRDLDHRAVVGRCRPTCSDELARLAHPFDAAGHPVRGRAAGRQGPARGLARGAVPRHPGHAVRPADGGPPAARADAAASCRRARPAGPAPGRRAAPPGTYL